ncbi:hypothetical protein BegalDRAFT_0804 [Beggiatoa alba B18LD]|uniref:Uncharacterized protein n=1 Tax=Beggiatoa alba B18LD TaxID=395493 RepID=I3CDM2_9GAMM|nr:hypothetical protein BegalDRAFT_0804 [Beggiatoa alba B18LD]
MVTLVFFIALTQILCLLLISAFLQGSKNKDKQ